MPHSPQDLVAELHNLAAHAHAAATVHGIGDHLTAHEMIEQAHEHSTQTYEYAKALNTVANHSSQA